MTRFLVYACTLLVAIFIGTSLIQLDDEKLVGGFYASPGRGYTASPGEIPMIVGGLLMGDTDGYGYATTSLYISAAGKVGIGTTTPTNLLQVTNTSSNSTSTIEIGKTGQNKGTCLKLYNNAGTATYCSITGTTLSCSANSCQ